jgi:hypothetical protein
MKTKKVFGSFKGITVGFAFAILGIVTGIHSSNHTFLICGSIFGIWSIFTLYFRFYPFFSYNDEFLIRADLLKGWGGTEKIRWEDIDSITTNDLSGITFIVPKNGNLVPMNSLMMPNYFQLLSEIVDLLKKNNPDVKISNETLKRIKKNYKQKNIYLFIVLILLFILMWAMMRFHWFVVS